MSQKEIEAICILKTAPIVGGFGKEDLSLITLNIKTPYYVWVELLTHKRLSRNASSNRAMSTSKNAELGYFCPSVFHNEQRGMSEGDDCPDDIQMEANKVWKDVWEYCTNAMDKLQSLGIHKGQASRVLPAFKMMNAVVTATQSAWMDMLKLRLVSNADSAMQELARKISQAIYDSPYKYDICHQPYLHRDELDEKDWHLLSAGRIARISYGSVQTKQGDIDLALRLLKDGHLSPFEHSATWLPNPILSNLNSKNREKYVDKYSIPWGWQNVRSEIEEE